MSSQSAFARTPECLPMERLAAYAAAPGSPANASARAHLETCPVCQTELALLEEFERGVVRPEEEAAVKWISARLKARAPALVPAAECTSWWKAFFVAPGWRTASVAFASLVLVVSAGLYLRHDRAPLIDTRGGAEVMRSQSLGGMAPAGDLAAAPAELRWEAVAGAVSYDVRIEEVDRTELWRQATTVPTVPLPAAIRVKLLPGKTVVWEVTARNAAGQVVAASGRHQFRVKE